MKIVFNTSSLKDYEIAMRTAGARWDELLEDFLTTMGYTVTEQVIPRTPVDTGRLRRSWKVKEPLLQGTEASIEVYNDAKSEAGSESYASFVEYGHFTVNRDKFVSGQFMLTKSMEVVEQNIQKVFNEEVKKWVKEVLGW